MATDTKYLYSPLYIIDTYVNGNYSTAREYYNKLDLDGKIQVQTLAHYNKSEFFNKLNFYKQVIAKA